MNPTVAAAFAAELATLTPITDAPSDPLGYGTDLSCLLDCTDDFNEVSGPMVVVQAVVRRYITPRGSLLDDADYGCDVRGLLNHGTPIQDLRMMQSRMRTEALKEERVENVEVALSMNALASEVTATVRLVLRDERSTFAFVLSVTSSEVLLKLLQGAT